MATVWTGDAARGHRVAARVKAGEVGVNMPYTAFPGIPFGGYKQSGFGRELGLETLDMHLETKTVLVSTSPKPFNPFGLWRRRFVQRLPPGSVREHQGLSLARRQRTCRSGRMCDA